MSDHPDVPRVMFDDDGESMNVEEAVAKFRRYLEDGTLRHDGRFNLLLQIQVRPCDCEDDISGRDSGCPLHGDKS